MFAVSVMLCFLQLPPEGLRAQESSVARTIATSRNPVPVVYEPASAAPNPIVLQAQARRFEERFNKLVKAVEEFSVAYNRSKGQAWPSDKAAALKKAMAELQKADPSMKDDGEEKSVNAKR